MQFPSAPVLCCACIQNWTVKLLFTPQRECYVRICIDWTSIVRLVGDLFPLQCPSTHGRRPRPVSSDWDARQRQFAASSIFRCDSFASRPFRLHRLGSRPSCEIVSESDVVPRPPRFATALPGSLAPLCLGLESYYGRLFMIERPALGLPV